MNTKVVAMYLPQYHETEENNQWWGKGYTDWVAVKNAMPLFDGQKQPRHPLNNHYYDLTNKHDLLWQSETAEKYGVYGFGIYHYWFSSKQVLLDAPAKKILETPEFKTKFFFTWDNGSWKRTWSNVKFSNDWAPLYEGEKKGPEILAELNYGGKDEWEKHFEYLLPFFKDDRYIKIGGKPLFGVFNQDNDPDTLRKMFLFWNQCAINQGFPGVAILGKTNTSNIRVAEYQFYYEPATHGLIGKNNFEKALLKVRNKIRIGRGKLKTYYYSTIWRKIISDVDRTSNLFPGAFVRYDDTPRRGKNSSIVLGDTPELFGTMMTKLLKKANQYNKEFVFLTAWNEWGEGAYLEPDEEDEYAYLEALKKAIEEAN